MSLANLSSAYTDMQIRLAFSRTKIEDLEDALEAVLNQMSLSAAHEIARDALRSADERGAQTPSASRRRRLVDTGFDDD
jgi:hypothetical protein